MAWSSVLPNGPAWRAGVGGWVAEQEGCCPHLVAPVYAAAHGSTHGCQPASTPTHTLLADFHLMFAAPSTQSSSPPLLLMERHTAAGVQMCIIHLLQTQKQRKHVFPHFHTTLRDTLGWTCEGQKRPRQAAAVVARHRFPGYGRRGEAAPLAPSSPCFGFLRQDRELSRL